MCLYKAQISGERLQDHWSSGFPYFTWSISILAHLSRRLIGELIVYEGIRPSSTFSNNFSSEAVRPILFIFHIIAYIGRRNK